MRVMAGAAQQIKRVTLELGGKSANIVFDDCDLERAAATAPYGVFDNAGQDCCARSRILVQRNVYDRFMELLEPAVKGVVVGDPTCQGHRDGAAGLEDRTGTSVASYVPDDAPVAFRGSAPSGPGYWFPPTVLTPQRTDRTVTEEIFGPVVTVLPFDDEADAIALANDTPYGLSGSIWTDNLSRALRVSRAVESGNLSVNSHSSVRYNTPFGGFKQSGLGRELGPDAPLHFTETKNVFFAIGESLGDEQDRPDPATGGQGRRHHRRRQRHRAGDRQADARGGRHDRHRGHRPGHRQGRRRRTRGSVRARRRLRPGGGRHAVRHRRKDLRLGRHRVQQRGHLARPRTT